jgi:lipopolysaccharide transport system permease protein
MAPAARNLFSRILAGVSRTNAPPVHDEMIRSKSHLVDVFFTKLRLNIKSEVSRTYLGYLWWILQPALYVLVLYAVFGVFLARGGENFVAFLVCGQVPFQWFSQSLMNSCNSLFAGRGLANQIAVTKTFFPLLSVFQDLVKQGVVFLLMLFVLTLYGFEPALSWIFVIFIVIVQLLFITACALVASAITAFIPDFRYLVSTATILIMFCSGIFYSYKEVILILKVSFRRGQKY